MDPLAPVESQLRKAGCLDCRRLQISRKVAYFWKIIGAMLIVDKKRFDGERFL
jgi:hypothetical protein